MSSPSIVPFGNEAIKNWKSAAGFLPTFEPAVKSWSLAERSAAGRLVYLRDGVFVASHKVVAVTNQTLYLIPGYLAGKYNSVPMFFV